MTNARSKPVRPLSSLAQDYLKEEQKQRRQEIENLIGRTESDQKNGLLFTGAIWGWLATNVDKLSGKPTVAIVVLPPLIMGFFYYRFKRITKVILDIAEYTLKLEELFDCR